MPSAFFQTLTGLEGSKPLASMSVLIAVKTSGLIVKSVAKGSALVIWSRKSSTPIALSAELLTAALSGRVAW